MSQRQCGCQDGHPTPTLRPSVGQSQSGCEVNDANQHTDLSLQHWLQRPLLGSLPEMTSEAAAISLSPCGLVEAVWAQCPCRQTFWDSKCTGKSGRHCSGQAVKGLLWGSHLGTWLDSSPGMTRHLVQDVEGHQRQALPPHPPTSKLQWIFPKEPPTPQLPVCPEG